MTYHHIVLKKLFDIFQNVKMSNLSLKPLKPNWRVLIHNNIF